LSHIERFALGHAFYNVYETYIGDLSVGQILRHCGAYESGSYYCNFAQNLVLQ
jgi:hypothetical protein